MTFKSSRNLNSLFVEIVALGGKKSIFISQHCNGFDDRIGLHLKKKKKILWKENLSLMNILM